MARYCADCSFLQVDDKGHGKYKCSKIGKEVLANMDACDKFEFSYKNKVERDKYYDMGKELTQNSSKSTTPTGVLIAVVILLVLALIICSIFL